jgi:hypothetical protein
MRIKETLFSMIIYQKLSTVCEDGAIAAINTFFPFSLLILVYRKYMSFKLLTYINIISINIEPISITRVFVFNQSYHRMLKW